MNDTLEIGRKGGILHVNRQFIAMNAKDGGRRPVYTLKPNGETSKPIYAREVDILGPSKAVFDGTALACGARAWIAIEPGTYVTLIDRMSFKDAKAA